MVYIFVNLTSMASNNSIRISPGNGSETLFINGIMDVKTPSDIRLKKGVSSLTYGLDALNALNPVQYQYIDKGNKSYMGLIAQEVEKVIPELVSELTMTAEDGSPLKSINYLDLIPIFVKAFQDQHTLITEIKEENIVLKKELKEIKATNNTN